MLSINHTGNITKWVTGEGHQKVTLDEVNEKEILLVIAAKLHSIRGMIMCFTMLTVVGFVAGLISLLMK